VIDLLVVPIQDEQFYSFYLVETGWGLLFSLLVAAPLVAFAVSPRSYVFVLQVMAVALAVLLPALVTPAARQVIPASLLALTAAVAWFGTGYGFQPLRGLSVRRVNRGLGALVLLAGVSAVVYASHTVQVARTAQVDDDTWGLMHLPMQAGFALALAGSAAVSVLAGTGDAWRWKESLLPAAGSSVWLGVVSFTYPDHLASVGHAGGVGCVVWGVLIAVVAFSAEPGRNAAV
jgi:hypothetical protein